ncbi:hypothetical protein [Psychrobacter cibarius]|uniref:hypothetical protein n=1 Tax=Psychrobacter cibarius TaxID=282669 RepID=UPI001B7D387F|nr:hypothetical protein [Psychrobacter cibarius]
MSNFKLVVGALTTLILMSIGCSHKEPNSVNEVKENSSEAITKNISEEVEVRGNFKRSFEVYQLEANGKTYYVADPKQLLIENSNKIGQDGYYKSFETCVVGVIGSEGGYGPTGKYENKITVSKVCV